MSRHGLLLLLVLAAAPAAAEVPDTGMRCLVRIGEQPDDQGLEASIAERLALERCSRGDVLFLQYIPHTIPPLFLASALCDFRQQVVIREYPTHLFGHMTNLACVYAGHHRRDH
ncbi:hypothetical protein JYK14_16725 [Siccirubricoccus sp. KC 17139]|uniref:Uncharacterized protein n=1 Tax=Siccirubricoccus soli TaxID=2899147 RepID=A0ABT1D9C7_9PROT|nr:hypothetical protein [Siccirubricoccus soli]MCO6417794.1 hypothetical protein [Siccirubricoccus soli]MCP2683929.1 hypothetical protein [Siccirubricoccus soli]